LEVNKVGLSAGDGGQWNVLSDGNNTVMSAEEALARCAAQLMADSATPVPERTKVSSSIIELLKTRSVVLTRIRVRRQSRHLKRMGYHRGHKT